MSFLYSLALGAGIGLFYDFFRILRIAFPHRVIIILAEDLLFWTITTFVTFLFFFNTDGGRIRLFLIVGEFIGFVLWYFTVGVLVINMAKKVIAWIRWLFSWIYRLIIHPILFVFQWIFGFLSAAVKSIGNLLKKQLKNSNRHLQKYRHVLYNQRKHLKSHLPRKSQVKDCVENEKDENI